MCAIIPDQHHLFYEILLQDILNAYISNKERLDIKKFMFTSNVLHHIEDSVS